MQESLASRITKITGTVMVAFLILSFALWGVGDVFRNKGGSDVAARAGNQEIPMQDYERGMTIESRRIQQMLGQPVSEEALKHYGVPQRVISTLVNRSLMRQETAKLGLGVSDEAVKQDVRGDERFFGEAGKFSREHFEQFLHGYGLTEAQYVEDVRHQLATEMLMGALSARAPVTKEEVSALFAYREEQRKASLLVLPKGAAQNVGEPSAPQLEAYYEKEKERFAAPEMRSVTYLSFGIENVAHEVDLSDAALRAEYDQHKEALGPAEKRTLKQAVVEDEAKAKAIAAVLEKQKDMEVAAKEAGEEKAVSELGAVTQEELEEPNILPAEAVLAIFTLPEGGHTAPFKTVLGWHVVQVRKIEKGKIPGFEEVKAKIRESLLAEKGGDALYKLSTQVEDKLASGAKLEDVASALNLKTAKLENLNQKGKMQGEAVARIPDFGDFLAHTFKIGAGEVSELVGSPEGTKYFAVQVDGITPPRTRALAEVRDNVAEVWKDQQRRDRLKTLAEGMASTLSDGKGATLESMVSSIGGDAKVVAVGPLKRDYAEGAILPLAAVKELFALEPGKTGRAWPRADGGFVIVRADKVIAPEESKREVGEAAVAGELANGFGQDVQEQVIIHLRNTYPVREYVQ